MRRGFPAGVAALGIAAGLVLGACSSDPPPALLDRGATTTIPVGPVAFNVKSFDLEAIGPVDPAEHANVQAAVLETLGTYLADAVVAPLQTGSARGDVAALFTMAARDRAVTAPDRNSLFDEGLPAVAGLRPETADLELTGLAGADGKLAVVSARATIVLSGTAEGTPLTVSRSGEFLLVSEEGRWRIDAYSVKASRDTPAPTAPGAAP